MTTSCLKCNRILKNPKSVERGYGAICFSKAQKENCESKTGAGKSDYTYHTREADGVNVLVIIDQDLGGMSVTNNVEAVVRSIADELGQDILQKPIIYRDSEGRYDGLDGTYLADPFYHIGTEDEARAAATAAERYWRSNTIYFTQDRAWREGFNDGIAVPDKLREIQALWAEWAKEYGDVGSCVIGAGFTFDYEGNRYKMPPTGPWQGSCSWEAGKDQIEERLKEAGATNIRYHWGNMD